MIELYEGRLGGGKTYSAAVRMVDHIRRGGIVCTNVELVWDEVKQYVAERFGLIAQDSQFIPLADDQIGLFHRHTPSGTSELPVLVVVDEAHLTFNSRDFAQTDKLYRETLTFLTQSRKVNTDIIFIAQSVLNMDKQFMRLVQFIWRFRDLAKWKIPGLGIAYPFKQILAVQFDYDGKTIMQRSFVKKDPRIFRLYNTNSLIREFPRLEAVNKVTLAKVNHTSKMAKFLIPLGVVVGIICAFVLYKKVMAIGTPKTGTTEAAREKATPTPTPSGNVNTTSKEKKENDTAYDIYAETFQHWNSKERTLRTQEGGWYQVGEMSSRGFVTAVSDRRARIAQPDGRTGWVVSSQYQKVAPTFATVPTQITSASTPSPTPIGAVPTQIATPAATIERTGTLSDNDRRTIGIIKAGGIPPAATPSIPPNR
jgi:hypothetical protein